LPLRFPRSNAQTPAIASFAIKWRKQQRFPEDFSFRLTAVEALAVMRSQIAAATQTRRNIRLLKVQPERARLADFVAAAADAKQGAQAPNASSPATAFLVKRSRRLRCESHRKDR
jgi:hypothetical protein